MKTASLSQCRILTVITKADGGVSAAQWNLNHIDEQGTWSLIILERDELEAYPNFEKLAGYTSGTLVVWQDLDKFGVGEEDTPALTPTSLMSV